MTSRRKKALIFVLVATIFANGKITLIAQSQNSVGGGANGASMTMTATVLGAQATVSRPSVAPVTLPPDGGSFTNQAAGSNSEIPGVLPASSTGFVINETSGSVTLTSAHAESTSTVDNLNMLNGLITASKIVSKSTSDGDGKAAASSGAGSFVEGLTIAGAVQDQREFPPNTSIPFSGNVSATVAGLPVSVPVNGIIIINEQAASGNAVTTSSLTVNYLHVQTTGNSPGMLSFTQDEIVASASSSVDFTATTPTNHPPILNLPGPQTAQVGKSLTFIASATDPDTGDTVSLAANGIPVNAAFTPNPATGNPASGQFSFTPTQAQAGQTFTVNFTATDSHGASVSQSVQINVSSGAPSGNNPPVLSLPGPQSVEPGNTLSFDVSAADPDSGDTVTLAASGVPSNANVSPNPSTGNPAKAHFDFAPAQSQAGQIYNVSFSATDSHGASATGSVQISVTSGAPPPGENHPPTLSVPGPQIIGVGGKLDFTVTASDSDGDAVTLSASSVPANASFNPATGAFTFTPADSQANQVYVVTFTATDAKGASTTATVQITVVKVSNLENPGPPIISVPPSPLSVRVGDELKFLVAAVSRVANCSVSITASGAPANAAFETTTDQFGFTPTLDQKDKSFLVTFTATDCTGKTAAATVDIMVFDSDASGPGHVCVPVTKIFFGPTPVNSTCGAVTVTLSNMGGGPLTISSIGFLDGKNFRVEGVSGLPAVLGSAATIQLRIVFEPKEAGSLLDTLTISTSDPDQSTITIDVKGKASK